MTAHKHLKQIVRARMSKTGESYASARRQVMRQPSAPPPDPAARWHFPGNIPATTALRVLLTHAGVRAPHTGEPYSEAMLFGIAGGVGAGVFSFVYEQEDFASFFVAGRHNWQDDLGYLRDACQRLGIEPVIRESGGAKAAEKHLREALAEGPCAAWVDMAHLPHRALPKQFSGGGYHVVTVYRIDAESGTALIGDLGDGPISIALTDLSEARGRIKKQKNRLLSIKDADGSRDLSSLVRDGLKNCYDGRPSIGAKVMTNFTLEAFRVWGERMHASKDKESWERIFPRGARLWTGLTSIYDNIENYGTGGGLCRPVYSDFLLEAAAAIGSDALRALGEQYADLGRRWTELAEAALPDDLPAFQEAKRLLTRKVELTHAGGEVALDEVRQAWKRLGELKAQARAEFPLTEAECSDLRAGLQARILALYETEVAARAAVGLASSSL
jgi:Domain of unknown function (DUF4872)/Butirosin biosynthesis protein H, N-terminal